MIKLFGLVYQIDEGKIRNALHFLFALKVFNGYVQLGA